MHFEFILNCIDLGFLSGQGLPLASDNVKYWCLVRCPFWFTWTSLRLQVWYSWNYSSWICLKSLLTAFCSMVEPMMSGIIPFRQKTFITFTALRIHGREHNVWWNLSRQKTFLTFTALRVHGTAHDASSLSFSSKNVSHIYCTSSSWYSPWCLLNIFFVEKRFSHFMQHRVHGREHNVC